MEINGNTPTALSTSALPYEPKMKSLGQEDFLQLLVTQLTSQDPMNPQKDTDFIAQMAQFSALEQTRNVWDEVSQLRSQQQLTQADAMIGRTVSVQAEDEVTIQGVVSAVTVEDGLPKIIVDGSPYDMSQVLVVEATPTGR